MSTAWRFVAAGDDQQKAAPVGLLVLLLLGVACYFLFKSMSRHLRRVRDGFPAGAAIPDSAVPGGTLSGGKVSGGKVSGGTVSGGTVSGGTVSGGTVDPSGSGAAAADPDDGPSSTVG